MYLRFKAFPEVLPGVISHNATMKTLAKKVEKIAKSDGSIFINGETGVGKELFALAIHTISHKQGDLVSVNCSAVPESLFESLFFGHEKGAFTGADKKQQGFFHQAMNGTLFLDEIGELPLLQQAKLLRVLETKKFSRVGGNEIFNFQGRVVCASHVDISNRVKAKQFREDLWYRLNLFEIDVPSLNERRDDIPLLASFFAGRTQRISFLPDALEFLQFCDWPGNVRQLRNMVEKISVLSDTEEVSAEVIQSLQNMNGNVDWAGRVAMEIIDMPISNKLKSIYDALIQQAVVVSNGNKSEAARLLGVHRKVVERRLAQISTVDNC